MESEQMYVFYEIRPGMAVRDAEGIGLGTVESLWGVTESGQEQELSIIEGLGPSVEREGVEAASLCLPQRGYLIASKGLMGRSVLRVPLEAIAEVSETEVVLSQTMNDLTE